MNPEIFGKKVLIVEDDQDTRALLHAHVKRAGYAPVEACDAEDGLKKLKEWEPDVVILDIMMPGIDGWYVLKKIKTGLRKRVIPVVVLTGRDSNEDRLKGYKLGADFYLTKPCNMKQLLSVLERLLLEYSD